MLSVEKFVTRFMYVILVLSPRYYYEFVLNSLCKSVCTTVEY